MSTINVEVNGKLRLTITGDNLKLSGCDIRVDNNSDGEAVVKLLATPDVIPRFTVGDTVKTIISKNKDKIYRQERKGVTGVVEKTGISLNKICYWVNFGDHNSWIDEDELNVV